MWSDLVSFCALIAALSICITYSLNRVGYDFKAIDTGILCLLGIAVFSAVCFITSWFATIL